MTKAGQSTDGEAEPLVVVLDDDPAVRTSVGSLLRSVGFRVETYGAAQDFLASATVQAANCLILDIRLPRVSGLDFQNQLAAASIHVPIIFMTGHGDIPMTVRAMKAGAVDFLSKPFRDQDMLDAVAAAVEKDMLRRDGDGIMQDQQARYRSLSDREQQVMALAIEGLLNKQIAFQLGISEITVKIHRGRVMRKMDAQSFAGPGTNGRVVRHKGRQGGPINLRMISNASSQFRLHGVVSRKAASASASANQDRNYLVGSQTHLDHR